MDIVKNKPYLVAITGSFGSGKSTVIDILKNKGYKTLKADDITKLLWEDNNFRNDISLMFNLKNDHNLKQNLKNKVFEDNKELEKLNNFTHPLIEEKLNNFIKDNILEKILFYENALIFETKQEENFDYILLVYTSLENQVNRLKEKNIEDKLINNIINNQYSNNKKVLMADGVIYNNDDISFLEEKVDNILQVIFNEPYFKE